MKSIEIDEEKFNELELPEDVVVFEYLLENYNEESTQALGDFVEFEQEMNLLSDSQLVQFFNIYDYSELIEWIDDYIDDEVLVNYFVKDCCGTDLGVWEMVVLNGYVVN